MDRADVNAKVIAIIAHILNISKEAIKENATLESLGADSLNRVKLVMELEEAFGIEIKDEDAEALTTVSQTVDYVQQMTQS